MRNVIGPHNDASVADRILLEEALLRGGARSAPEVLRGAGPWPLSHAQEGIWFFEQLQPGSGLYIIPQAFWIRGSLDIEALELAFKAVIARHVALRLRIFASDAGVMQERQSGTGFRLRMVDVSELSAAEQETRIREETEAEAREGFDLGSGLLIRARVIRCGAAEQVLLVSLHHIIADYQSLGILYRELSEAYQCMLGGGREPAWEKLEFQFPDLCQFERWRAELMNDSDRQYWLAQLGSAPVTGLPVEHGRPSVQSFRGARVPFFVSEELTERLKNLSEAEGVTLNVLLLAAFNVLLFRYSDEEDVVVGIPISKRAQRGADRLIGFFINVLPLRSRLDGGRTFRDTLRQINSGAVELYVHSDVPFLKLTHEFTPDAHARRPPLFQVVFQYFSEPLARPRFGNAGIEPIFVGTDTAKFDLTLTLINGVGGLNGELEFCTDLFGARMVERMIANFQALLEGVSRNPDEKLSCLPLLDGSERAEILELCFDGRTAYPRHESIGRLFREEAKRCPEAEALRFGSESMTYGELERRSNQLAHYLKRAGAAKGSRIGVGLCRSVEMIVSLLAILKTGGCYVPLDPSLPQERLKFICEDAAVGIVISLERWRGCFGNARNIIALDSRAEELGRLEGAELESEVDGGDPAYVLFTSGSTGQPKGVVVPHRGVVRLVKGSNYLSFGPENVFLQFAPLSFDASTLEIWGPLLNGGTLVIFPPAFESIEQLGRVLEENQVDTLWLTAGLFHEIVDHHLEALKPVRRLLAGGESLSSQHVRKFLNAHSSCELINGYGPTENTTFTCCYRIPGNWSAERPVPIGRPISNSWVCIVDRFLNPTPFGMPGELCTGGDGLAEGYLNRPELTAEKFVPNPLDPRLGRMYRTGDLARYVEGGVIEFLGRRDDQVKIRGFRVELGEIEHAIRATRMVEAAAVVLEEEAGRGKMIVAYVVAGRPGITAERLREALARTLPGYTIPSRIRFVDKLAITANGKIDRRKLSEHGRALGHDEVELGKAAPAAEVIAAREQPASQVEQQLAAIWREVLCQPDIGTRDNFFELGGHSLLATRIVSRVNREFKRNLPLSILFEAPTIAALAGQIEKGAGALAGPALQRRGAMA